MIMGKKKFFLPPNDFIALCNYDLHEIIWTLLVVRNAGKYLVVVTIFRLNNSANYNQKQLPYLVKCLFKLDDLISMSQ